MKKKGDHGYASLLVLGMTLIAIGVAGLAIDGTRAFLFRRSLQNAADSAALAGASEIDRAAYYASGGSKVDLDPEAAQSSASEWLVRRGLPSDAQISAQADGVRVVLRGEVDTTFLRVIGIGRVPVAVESVARPISGDP